MTQIDPNQFSSLFFLNWSQLKTTNEARSCWKPHALCGRYRPALENCRRCMMNCQERQKQRESPELELPLGPARHPTLEMELARFCFYDWDQIFEKRWPCISDSSDVGQYFSYSFRNLGKTQRQIYLTSGVEFLNCFFVFISDAWKYFMFVFHSDAANMLLM